MKTRFDYLGLSTDDKPTEKAVNGSTFKEVDTSKLYIFYNGEWYEKVEQGGGGGSSFPPDWSEIGYNDVPSSILKGFNYAKQIYNNWDSTITNANALFKGDRELKYFPIINTSNIRLMYQMMDGSNVEEIPLIDMNDATNIREICYQCYQLIKINAINTSKVTDARKAFEGCSLLESIPVFSFASMQYATGMFNSCSKLSNNSLNNILESCISATSAYASPKTLAQIGLTSEQATTCQGLSNWEAFVEAGWTSGY